MIKISLVEWTVPIRPNLNPILDPKGLTRPTPKSDLLINPNFNPSEGQLDPIWPDFEPWGSKLTKFNPKNGSGSAN